MQLNKQNKGVQEEVKNWENFELGFISICNTYNVMIRNGCIYIRCHILISVFDHTQSLSQLHYEAIFS